MVESVEYGRADDPDARRTKHRCSPGMLGRVERGHVEYAAAEKEEDRNEAFKARCEYIFVFIFQSWTDSRQDWERETSTGQAGNAFICPMDAARYHLGSNILNYPAFYRYIKAESDKQT